MVDEKKISFNPAVELSLYLDKNQQRDFLEAMSDLQDSPSLSQAQRLKKLAQEGHFSYDVAFAVMGEPKKGRIGQGGYQNDAAEIFSQLYSRNGRKNHRTLDGLKKLYSSDA